MIYYLTEDQWHHLWDDNNFKLDHDYYSTVIDARCKYWYKHLQPKYNLIYKESLFEGEIDHWGSVEGEEKHINWFLLHL
jgi:hypothetical protein